MIFLDMDGVLCDFATAAYAVHGKAFDPVTHPKGVWDFETIWGISAEQFWQRIDERGEDFWANLEPYPWAMNLARALGAIDQVIIATSPSTHPGSYAGKRQWLIKMGLHEISSMFGKDKWLMASSGRVLIDDSEKNIEKWRDYGGIGILIPQPWNNAAQEIDIVSYVCGELKGFQ